MAPVAACCNTTLRADKVGSSAIPPTRPATAGPGPAFVTPYFGLLDLPLVLTSGYFLLCDLLPPRHSVESCCQPIRRRRPAARLSTWRPSGRIDSRPADSYLLIK